MKNWKADGKDSLFTNGMQVRFTDAGVGAIAITESLAPGSIVVENSVGKDYTFFGTGQISGNATLTKIGDGTLTIRNANGYTGGTTIKGGALVVRHAKALGHGAVTFDGGLLDLGVFRPLNDFNLKGGTVALRKAEGSLQLGKVTTGGNGINIDYGDLSDYLTGESYTLATLGGGSSVDAAKLTLVNSNLVSGYSFEVKGGALLLNLEEREATTLTWDAKQGTWGQRADGDLWQTQGGLNDGHFHDGDAVLINVSDNITIAGIVAPRAVEVQGAKGVTIHLTGEGGMTGGGTLRKLSQSTLILETANSYTGGTVLEEGTLRVGNVSALGAGRVTLKGGVLDMGGLTVGNAIQVGSDSLATIVNGGNYAGTVLLSGGSLRLEGTFGGDLILSGGLLDLTGLTALQLNTVVTSALTQINVGDLSGLPEGANILLTLGDSSVIDTAKLEIVGLDAITSWNKSLELQDNKLMLVLSEGGEVDPPVSDKDMVLEDVVTPEHLDIGGDEDSAITGSGSIAGNGNLDKDGKGNLTISTENPDWTGDININGGTITAGNSTALGTGDVNLNGGDLYMGGNSIGNDVVVNADATINGGGDYQGGLTVNNGTVDGGEINLGQDATLNKGTVNNNLIGDGGVIKNTAGSVTINGDNSYTGGTTITDGTIIAGTNTALGTGDVNMNGGTLNMGGWDLNNDILVTQDSALNGAGDYRGTLTLRSGTLTGGSINIANDKTFQLENGTLGNKLTGEGGVSKLTDGSVTLNGNNSFAGGVAISAGTLTAGHASAFGTGAVALEGGTLDLGGQAVTNAISATGGTISGAGSYAGALTVSGSVTLDGPTKAGSITLIGGTLTGGSISDTAVSATSGTISSVIGGTSSVTSSGDLTLSGANNYTGGTTLSGGTLTVGNASALGTGTVALNGSLNMGGLAVNNTITIGGGELATIVGGANFGGTVNLNGGTLNLTETLGGTLALNGGLLDLSGMASATLGTVTTSALTRINVGDLSSLTEGTHTLLTLGDGTGVDASLVQIVGLDAITGWNTALEVQGNDLVLVLSALPQITDDIILDGADKVLDSIVTPGSIQVGGDGDSGITGAGCISGNGALNKTGSGTLTIGTENPDWTGDTTISGGTIIAGANTALGTGGVNMNGGSLNMGGWDLNNDIIVTQDSALNGAGDYRGTLTLRSGTLTGGSINIANDKTFQLENGTLGNKLTGEGGVSKLTDGSVTLNGNNSFAGGVAISAGTLTAGHASAFGTGAVALEGGTLDLGGQAVTNAISATDGTISGAGSYAGALTVSGNVTLGGTTQAGSLALTGGTLSGGSISDTAIAANSGTISSVIGGTSSVTIRGEVTLDGANNYTGGTTLSGGTLTVGNASALGTGTVALNGSLNMGGLTVNNTIAIGSGELATIVGGSAFAGTVNLNGGTLNLTEALGGTLALNGGLLDLTAGVSTLSMDSTLSTVQLGAVETTSLTSINVGDLSGLGEGTHTLLSFNDGSGIDTDKLDIIGLDAITGWNKSLELQGNDLVLVLSEIKVPVDPTEDVVIGGDGGKDKELTETITPGHIDVEGDEDSSITGNGSIAGDGNLDKDGEGNLTIDTENPNWTGDININDGTITAGSDTALGTGDVNLNGGTLDMGGNALGNDVNVNDDATITGGETYQGGLTVNNGTVNGGEINLGQDATLNKGTINNDLTGNGGVIKNTDGSVTLTGDNSYTGGTTINGGTLTAGSDTALGTGEVNLNGGTLDMGGNSLGNDVTATGGSISGADAFTGELTVDGNVSLGGETHAGSLTMEGGILSGGSIHDTGVTAQGGTIISSLTGNSSVTGEGDATLFGDNSYDGGTTINGGTLTAGSGTALGTGNVTLAGGNLNMGGQGLGNDIAVEKDAVISGGGDYRGTLTLGNGTLSGGSLNIAAGKDFVLESGAIENKLTGDGGVIKNTDGSVTLNGSNSYGGGTVINSGTLVAGGDKAFGTGDVTVGGGTLDLDGKAIANNILLNDGATLQNGGAAKNIDVAAGAGIRLGNHSIGAGQTMSFGGNNSVAGKVSFGGGTLVLGSPNLTFTDVVSIVPGSVTTLDVSAFGNTLAAGGTMGLIDFAGGLEDYTEGCLSVIGVGGGLTPDLQFDAATGKLVLNVSEASKPDEPITPPDEPVTPPSYKVDPDSLGGNRGGIYTQLADADRENRYGDVLGALAHTVAETTDAAELKKLLGQVGGSVYTTQMGAQIDGNRAAMGTLRDLMGYGQEPVRKGSDYRFAVQATSALSSADGDANAPGYDRRGFGGLLMAETSVAEDIVAGLSVGYEHATVEADGSDKWESDDTRLNAHLMVLGKTWQSRSILGIGMHGYDMKRHVNAGGISGTAQSSPDGFSVNFMEELACRVKLDEESSVEPFLRIESSYNSIDGATESGTLGNAALVLDSQDAWATTVTLGTRYVQQFSMGGVLPTSRLMAEAGVSKSIGAEGAAVTAHFAGDPAHGFRITPAERDRWGVMLGGSLLLPLDNTQMINIGGKVSLRGSSTEVNANVGYQIVF